MARLRTIKPGFFTDDQLAEVPALGRLLFAGLWCLSDRAGRLEDRPKRIKAEVLPYDSANVDRLLQDLHDRGFIRRYEIGGQRFIQVLNFSKHQNPHVKEPESTIPAPDEYCADTVQEQFSPGSPTIGLQSYEQSYEQSLEQERESGASTRPSPPSFSEDEQRVIDRVTLALREYDFKLAPGHWRKVLDCHPGVDLEDEAFKQADWLRRNRVKTCSAARYTNWLAKAKANRKAREPDEGDGECECEQIREDLRINQNSPRICPVHGWVAA